MKGDYELHGKGRKGAQRKVCFLASEDTTVGARLGKLSGALALSLTAEEFQ